MSIWLIPEDELIFPHPFTADKSGVLAMGGDLTPERLILAYRFGIFPWYGPDEPLLWWCPDPRCVLAPENVIIQKSMRPYLNQKKFDVTVDTAFEEVIMHCQNQARKGQEGSWIHGEVREAYCRLFEMGFAHSFEVRQGDQMVGGLYGIALGRIFFGESMFSRMNNASKYALIFLCQYVQKLGFNLIDCQQDTPHLRRMGAELINHQDFMQRLKANLFEKDLIGSWI